MPAVSSLIAAAAVAASAIGSVAQNRMQKKQARAQKKQNERAEELATVQAKQVQATEDIEETDIALESSELQSDRKAQTGSRLQVGKKRTPKLKKKSGVKL